jgi:bifunctional UDP-N-acetylglucosamine pyrophosphorylase/glucosamine-1-phosphate N-acetyltransferase
MKNICAIVLAAGKGKRMKSDLPKVLHQISGLPMVSLVINTLKKAGIKKIIVVVGFGSNYVKKILPKDVDIVDQGDPLGTGHAVLCTKKILSRHKGEVLVTCGDMPLIKADTFKNIIKVHKKNKASCTILTGIMDNPAGYGRIVRKDGGGAVLQICEDKDGSEEIKKIREINSGTYCFNVQDLFKVLPLVDRKNKQGEFYLTDTIDILVKKGYIVRALCSDQEEIYGISSRIDLAHVQSIMNKRILNMHMENGVTIIDPDATYIDIRAKIGRDTVINPFTVIDGDVTIERHCEVGPFTHLRDKAFLDDGAEIGNFVEVKKSKIGNHTKAKHLTYIGDTIIGKNVNIGAGTITANYDGKDKYQTVIKDKAFIGSGTILVAPVSVGKNSITGAGSVVVRNRNVPDNAIVVGVPAKQLRKIK